MTAAEIARALGNAHRSGRWWRARCPVHHCQGSTLALREGERWIIVHCHAGCEPRDILTELWRRGLIEDRGERRSEPRSTLQPLDDDSHRIAMARRLWEGGRDARGSPAERYLRSRGIEIPPPSCLRWASACRHPAGRVLPAMLARIEAVDGELIGVHRTFLRPDGSGKADIEPAKAMLGRAASGAVRLGAAPEKLLIGEGIETCLAAMQATAMPAWAALSTSGMVAVVLPPMVRTVIILADHDVSGAGERAARTAGARWLAEGRRVRIAMPPEPGSDFNDVLAGRANASIAEVSDVAA
jgi:putative DNA primase/helicase